MLKLSSIRLLIILLAVVNIGCEKAKTQPANSIDQQSTQNNNSADPSIIPNIDGIRIWTGNASSSPGNSQVTVNDTFEITALPDSNILVKNRTLEFSWIDTTEQKMSFQLHNEPTDWHFTVYYYYGNDSIVYQEYHHISAGGATLLDLHTID